MSAVLRVPFYSPITNGWTWTLTSRNEHNEFYYVAYTDPACATTFFGGIYIVAPTADGIYRNIIQTAVRSKIIPYKEDWQVFATTWAEFYRLMLCEVEWWDHYDWFMEENTDEGSRSGGEVCA